MAQCPNCQQEFTPKTKDKDGGDYKGSGGRFGPGGRFCSIHCSWLGGYADDIRKRGKRVCADIIEIGRLLIECKKLVKHGEWQPWIDREFGWDERTAQRFMRVHELAGKTDKLSDLSIPISSLYLLAASSTPEPARQEAIERAQAGETLSHADVKEIVAKHKPQKESLDETVEGADEDNPLPALPAPVPNANGARYAGEALIPKELAKIIARALDIEDARDDIGEPMPRKMKDRKDWYNAEARRVQELAKEAGAPDEWVGLVTFVFASTLADLGDGIRPWINEAQSKAPETEGGKGVTVKNEWSA